MLSELCLALQLNHVVNSLLKGVQSCGGTRAGCTHVLAPHAEGGCHCQGQHNPGASFPALAFLPGPNLDPSLTRFSCEPI